MRFKGFIGGLVLACAQAAQVEMYVAGQIGAHLPQDISDMRWSAGGVSVGGNDLSLSNSFMYGAKLGYYFDQLPWLGVETEVYNATPHVQQQNITIGTTNFGTNPGTLHRVLAWSPFTVVARYQMGKLEPYAGVGLGVFFSHLSSGNASSSDTAVGLNTQVGLRYRINQHLAAFGEWKYNMASLNHTNVLGSGLNIEGDYRAHILAFGLGYHF